MNIGTAVIVKRSQGLPAWQAEFIGQQGIVIGQKCIAGVLHWLVKFGKEPPLEYLPCELAEIESRQPLEAAA